MPCHSRCASAKAAPCLGSAWHHWRKASACAAVICRSATRCTHSARCDRSPSPAGRQTGHAWSTSHPCRAEIVRRLQFAADHARRNAEMAGCVLQGHLVHAHGDQDLARRAAWRRSRWTGPPARPAPSPGAPDRDSGPPVRRPADPVPCRSDGGARTDTVHGGVRRHPHDIGQRRLHRLRLRPVGLRLFKTQPGIVQRLARQIGRAEPVREAALESS